MMFDTALLHPIARKQLQDYASHPSHALLIAAPEGAGKEYVSRLLTAHVLGLPSVSQLDSYPYFQMIEPENGTISVEAVRSVYDFFRLKTTGETGWRRVLLIKNAHTMNVAAQNAFLKLLEEPPADTMIVLTAQLSPKMLPTITSRTQHISLRVPGREVAIRYFAGHSNFDTALIERQYHLAEGQVGLMQALLANDTAHPLADAIKDAKTLLASSAFERLSQVDQWSKNKESLVYLLAAIQKICHAALKQAAVSGKTPEIQRWRNRLAAATTAHEYLAKKAQTKLLLTDLFLSL